MASDANALAIIGLCFLLTHVAAPIATLIAAVMAARTSRADMKARKALTIALWLAAPWMVVASVLAAVGENPIDALLHSDSMGGAIPIASLVVAIAVAIGVVVRWRRREGDSLNAR